MTVPTSKRRRNGEDIAIPVGQKDQNMFETLPNEVILQMFSYLRIVDLLKCGQVSKRFRAVSNGYNLWPRTELSQNSSVCRVWSRKMYNFE